MKKMLILTLLVTVVAGFTLSCCGKMFERALEEAIEEEGGEDVDIDIGGLMGGKAKIPKNFPKELVYKGAKPVASFSMARGEGKGGSMLTLQTSASASRVARYYEGLDSKGWDIEAISEISTEEGEGTIYGLSKGDFGAVVTISEDDDNTVIIIIYGEDFAE